MYIVDEVGAHNRYDIGVANIMWGPDFPHSSSAGRSTTSSAARSSSVRARRESEIERIMWKNAADLYKLPYDEPERLNAAA